MDFLDREQVFAMMKAKGFRIFENDFRPYNLNIIGIRSKNEKLDSFEDQLFVAWKHNGEWRDVSYRITTNPGPYYLMYRLLSIKGCAILAEGQYINAYKIDKHNGKYDALCQRLAPVKVFRDKNKDKKFDQENAEMGFFGINIHRANKDGCTIKVGPHSAGCQVFKCASDFDAFMKLCKKAAHEFSNRFTYTLLEQ